MIQINSIKVITEFVDTETGEVFTDERVLGEETKKAKKTSGDFKIIKEMPNATLQELCKAIYDKAEESNFNEDKVVVHHYINRNTGWSITSIYNHMNIDGYEQVD